MGNILADCSNPGTFTQSETGDVKIVIRVDHALVHDMNGADVSGFKIGDQLVICGLKKDKYIDALSWRYRSHAQQFWPKSYRFQVPRENLLADVLSREGRMTRCVIQVPIEDTRRTMDNAMAHVEDAEMATSHASRFNEQMARGMGNMMNYHDQGEAAPSLKICAPVAAEVLASCAPEVLPRGCACTVTPYPYAEVTKFVFDGTDDFSEVPQAFFHFSAYCSNGAEFVCDIQGAEDDSGGFHIIDPVVLREDKVNMTSFLNSTLRETKKDPSMLLGPDHAPTEQQFDTLHPRCGQLCQSFDPLRRGAKGKKGFCGITCMT